MPKLTFASLILAVSALLTPLPALAEDRPRVVAVNYALAFFAERLGGDDIAVEFPVPAGTDPSFWRPGIADISRIQSADLILLNGAGFATWTTKASLPRSRIVDTGRGIKDRLIVTETVTHSHGEGGEHSHAATATYTWLDPDIAILQVEAIAAALTRKRLVSAVEANTRLEALTQDLRTLAAQLGELADLAKGTPLVASHPRYQYLARAIGLDIRSLEWEAGAVPDAEQLADLKALAEETGARILIWEASVPQEARDAVRYLGVEDIIFPPLARAPEGSDYLKTFGSSIETLAGAIQETQGRSDH